MAKPTQPPPIAAPTVVAGTTAKAEAKKRNRRTFPAGPEAAYLKTAFNRFVDEPDGDNAIRLKNAMEVFAHLSTGTSMPAIRIKTSEDE